MLGNFGAPLAAFFTAPLLARALGVDERGEVAAITAPFLLFVAAATVGIPEAVTYLSARVPNKQRAIARDSSLLLAALGILAVAALWFLAPVILNGPSVEVARIAALALLPALLVSGLRGFAAGVGAWGLISIERTITAVTRLAAIVALAVTDSITVESASLVIAYSLVVGAAAYLPLLRRMSPQPVSIDGIYGGPKQVISFGSRLWVGSLAGILLSRIDQTLMIPLSNTHELGIYAVAVSISEITLVFNSAVRDVIFAAEAAEEDERRLTQAARISTFLTLILCAAVGLATIWLLEPLFGSEFAPARLVVGVLLIGILVGNPGSVAGAGLSARGRPELRSYALVIACVVNVVLVIVLVPSLGALGAAIATVVGNLVAGAVCIFWMRSVFGVSSDSFIRLRSADVRTTWVLMKNALR